MRNYDGDFTSIVRAALNGDREAETRMLRSLHERFVAVAKRTLGGEDALDAAQETSLTLVQRYRSIEFGSLEEFNGWVHQILRNKIGNQLQKRKTRAHAMELLRHDHENEKGRAFSDPLFKLKLYRCMNRIRERHAVYARALNLRHLGYNTTEICSKLGISANALYIALSRGRRALLQCLNSIYEIEKDKL